MVAVDSNSGLATIPQAACRINGNRVYVMAGTEDYLKVCVAKVFLVELRFLPGRGGRAMLAASRWRNGRCATLPDYLSLYVHCHLAAFRAQCRHGGDQLLQIV